MPNFGDCLNVELCRSLFGFSPIWEKPKRCEAVFIGSVLEKFIYRRSAWTMDALWIKYARSRVHVWGSGFIRAEESEQERLSRRVQIRAVRGLRTLERMRKITGDALENVVLGDPGLLASKIYSSGDREVYGCGIIPHHAEVAAVKRSAELASEERASGRLHPSTVAALPLYDRLSRAVPGAVVINPESSPDVVVRNISGCATVLSSAMHGLIVSDCFGIPNIRISASDLVAGGDYKFRDYYSVFNRDRYRVLDVRTDIPVGLLEFVKNGYVDAADEIVEIQGNLMRSFPYASQGI
jgi:hypothetical protein